MSNMSHEPMTEMFIFETEQLLEQLEQIILASEKIQEFASQDINEIFRIMHTIKGSSAMMLYNNISTLAHFIEDLFFFLRESKPASIQFSNLTDLVLKGADFIQTELAKIKAFQTPDADPDHIIKEIGEFLNHLKKLNSISENDHDPMQKSSPAEKHKYYIAPENPNGRPSQKDYKALIFFEEGCQMENIRAFSVIHNLKDLVNDIRYYPENIMDDEAEEIIRNNGFKILFKTGHPVETIRENLMQAVFLKSLTLEEADKEEEIETFANKNTIVPEVTSHKPRQATPKEETEVQSKTINQSMISVNINKLDKLMDLVGELVTSESMVTQNPDLNGLVLENFGKAARQLKKITGELQDTVMSIRMVPLSATFQKMNRIVRDMSKKLGKSVQLQIIGEQTEVDKNIIEHISDPLMHLIRNAIDHGIEPREVRLSKGKDENGKITLEAKNAGGDVLIIVKDDGKGLDRDKILKKAKENGLVTKPESELSNREIFLFIFLPGFSTKENISEYSGRGVGMDVVSKNIEKVNGSVSVDSIPDEGTVVTIKIPLTLAIIDGMNIRVGKAIYTIPTISIREAFRPVENNVFEDTEGNEMIMIRGQCYRILRLHRLFNISTDVTRVHEGILIMAESDNKTICIFADELLGEQQVVVKGLPGYINKVKGLAGCTILGNGDISLILDVAQLTGLE